MMEWITLVKILSLADFQGNAVYIRHKNIMINI